MLVKLSGIPEESTGIPVKTHKMSWIPLPHRVATPSQNVVFIALFTTFWAAPSQVVGMSPNSVCF